MISHICIIVLVLKGLFVRECAEGYRCSRKTLCVCVWGKVLASGERGFQELDTNSFDFVTIRLDRFYYKNTEQSKYIQVQIQVIYMIF